METTKYAYKITFANKYGKMTKSFKTAEAREKEETFKIRQGWTVEKKWEVS